MVAMDERRRRAAAGNNTRTVEDGPEEAVLHGAAQEVGHEEMPRLMPHDALLPSTQP